MKEYFKDFDFSDFWDDNSYSLKEYVGKYPDDEVITSVEEELGGYKLPQSYIELMRIHNGGMTMKNCFPTEESTGWADDHVAITGIMGIGREKARSQCGGFGTNFWKEEWGYPDIGICIANTPTGGHEMIMLDYRKCGKGGEPEVVYVDQEAEYEITYLAKDFETFIKELVEEEEFDTSEEDLQTDLEKVQTGTFSPILLRTFKEVREEFPDADKQMRKLAEEIVKSKRSFSLHADEKSYLMYDFLFWLYSSYNTAESCQHYMNSPKMFDTSYELLAYELMIVFSISDEPYTFRTGGYAPDFIKDWWEDRVKNEYIIREAKGFKPSGKMKQQLFTELKKYQ